MAIRIGNRGERERLACALLLLCLFTAACASPSATMVQTTATFHNPISFDADPFITYYQGIYYLTGTHTGATI